MTSGQWFTLIMLSSATWRGAAKRKPGNQWEPGYDCSGNSNRAGRATIIVAMDQAPRSPSHWKASNLGITSSVAAPFPLRWLRKISRNSRNHTGVMLNLGEFAGEYWGYMVKKAGVLVGYTGLIWWYANHCATACSQRLVTSHNQQAPPRCLKMNSLRLTIKDWSSIISPRVGNEHHHQTSLSLVVAIVFIPQMFDQNGWGTTRIGSPIANHTSHQSVAMARGTSDRDVTSYGWLMIVQYWWCFF